MAVNVSTAQETIVQDTTKSLLFKLFPIEEGMSGKNEKGYVWDRIFRRREFHNPVNFIPMELRYGFGYNAGGGFLGLGDLKSSWMSYESDVPDFGGGGFSSRLSQQFDLDILKTNLAYYWFGNSWLDMHTGINLRYSDLLSPADIPDDWIISKSSWIANTQFSGKMFEVAWSQSLMLQWFESWYTTYRYTYGIAFSEIYSAKNSPTGYGPSQSFTMGARIIVDPGMTNRFAVGVDLKYTHTNINKIKDSKDLTPINNFTIQTAGIYATASVFFGGRKTKGDTGKMHYYRRDFIAAKRILEEFVDENPNHANVNRAKKLIVKSELNIPIQLMREGMSFDERGMLERAVEKYIRAKSMADSSLSIVIEDQLRIIALREVEKAEGWLNRGFGDSAIAHVTMVSGWYPQINHHLKRFQITHLLNQGENLYRIGLNDRALGRFDKALEMDPGLAFEIAAYKHQIASDLLTMADSLKDLNSLRFIVYALERTKQLTGGLNKANTQILNELKLKLSAQEEFATRLKIDAILRSEKEKKESHNPIELGMSITQVEDIMGSPSEIVSNGSERRDQLWIYRYENGAEVYLTFTNYKLFRIEED
jgi:tetratricopeptide (TPR) repeat protein